jgi:predicted O-linked N-acetylglucosamine transferase (SPINDLY family)
MQKLLTFLIFLFIIFYLPLPFCFAAESNQETIIKSYEKMQQLHEREQDILKRQKKDTELQKELRQLMEDRKASDENISEKPSDFILCKIYYAQKFSWFIRLIYTFQITIRDILSPA